MKKENKWADRLCIGLALISLFVATSLFSCGCRIGPDPEPAPKEAPELPDDTGIPMDAPHPVDPDKPSETD